MLNHPALNGFYIWQHRVLGWLLGWGVGNILAGLSVARHPAERVRQIGYQAATWGLIDAALALNGRRVARRKLRKPEPSDDAVKIAGQFRRILLINAGLDVLYILGGLRLIQAAHMDQRRQGIGQGIALQGSFLLIYDLVLARAARRWLN